ncbi:uncharacterized protein LOC127110689 [Lathyrus oleraceus]|uniref:uncharacterized protein LOC127110689 n=1 Tax=Pisum sativum TaxID=3888 RepID=UPI0021D3C538|nr:uncharacterized protein LOC127110689 [Pisum sativum]
MVKLSFKKLRFVFVLRKLLFVLHSFWCMSYRAKEESNDVSTLSIDELQSSLLVHEQRMKINQEKEDEQVLKIAGYGRDDANNRGCGRGRLSRDQIQCYKSQKLGHYQREYLSWQENDANFAEFDESGELVLMDQRENIKSNSQKWFLDSGCSNHMVGTEEWLFNFDERFHESVKLGDDSKMQVMGRGNLKPRMNDIIPKNFQIPDVQRKKLDVKSTKCVWMGVSEESKAYKLYDLVNNKILISKDVVFEESKGGEWNKHDKEDKTQSINKIDKE